MFEMRHDDRCTLPDDVFHHRLIITRQGFLLGDADYSFLTPGSGTKSVTKEGASEAGFPVNERGLPIPDNQECTPAPRACMFIDTEIFRFILSVQVQCDHHGRRLFR